MKIKIIYLSKCRQRGWCDKFWEPEGSTRYSLGTGGEHVIQPGNWKRALDAVWELEGSTWYSQGTGGDHLMQSGNWRVARYTVWELEGCTWSSQGTGGGRWCRLLISAKKNRKPIIQRGKKLRFWSGTGQIYRNRNGTGISPNSTGTGTGPEPEFRSGPRSYSYLKI